MEADSRHVPAGARQRVSNQAMGLRFVSTSVIAIVAVTLGTLPSAARQPDHITDPDAYAVYARSHSTSLGKLGKRLHQRVLAFSKRLKGSKTRAPVFRRSELPVRSGAPSRSSTNRKMRADECWKGCCPSTFRIGLFPCGNPG